MAALTSSARWAVEGAKGELTEEAIGQLRQVLSSYEESVRKMQNETKKPANAGEQ